MPSYRTDGGDLKGLAAGKTWCPGPSAFSGQGSCLATEAECGAHAQNAANRETLLTVGLPGDCVARAASKRACQRMYDRSGSQISPPTQRTLIEDALALQIQ